MKFTITFVCFCIIGTFAQAQSPTKMLLGEWEFVKPDPTQMDLYNTLEFRLDGKYIYTVSNVVGEGYWSLDKKYETLSIFDFQFLNIESKKTKFKFRVVSISEDKLVLSRKIKGKLITNTYQKIKN